jgi:hypothetical protein
MSKLFFDSKTHSRIHDPLVHARQAAEQESSLLLPCLSCFKQGLLCNINNTRGECSNCIESNRSIKSRIYYPCTPRSLASQKPTQSNELDLLDDELPGSDAELSQNGFVKVLATDKTNSTRVELGKMGEDSKYSCLNCNEKGPASHFEPTAEERSLGHIGRHRICETCRAFNASHSMEKKKCIKCKRHWPLSFFKVFKGRSLLRSFKAAKNADNLWKQCSKWNLQAKRNNCSYKLICTVPMCREAVSRAPHSPSRMAQHMELHKVRRDLEVLDTYPHPVKCQAPNSSQGDKMLGDGSPEDELSEDEMAEDEFFEDNITASLDQKEALQLLR